MFSWLIFSIRLPVCWLPYTIQKLPPEVFYKKGILKNFAKFTRKHGCEACNFIKKETLGQVFSCELCEIFKKTFFTEHLQATASDHNKFKPWDTKSVKLRQCLTFICDASKQFMQAVTINFQGHTARCQKF